MPVQAPITPRSERSDPRQAKPIRYLLSDVALRRLRAAYEISADLFQQLHDTAPAQFANSFAEVYCYLSEAIVEIEKCNIESAPVAMEDDDGR